ncbi:hypothetical protein YIM_32760 [Amycolatopsis sp. YIM 10]|nr:hypothetical protein YIM_32760 [Amycolatopsis sp. YIM 10]
MGEVHFRAAPRCPGDRHRRAAAPEEAGTQVTGYGDGMTERVAALARPR